MTYADTSVLIAWFDPSDPFSKAVNSWRQEHTTDFFWNPILRTELRHNLRGISGKYGAIAWHAYRGAETSARLRMHPRRLSDLLGWADDLSVKFSHQTRAGTWDCVHVAAALRLNAEAFITCDAAQAELAHLAKLPSVHLFR